MIAGPSQIIEAELKATCQFCTGASHEKKMSVFLLPKMLLHSLFIACVPAPRPGVAKKALDKGEDAPAGQIPGLQIAWMWTQGRNESIHLVPEMEYLVSSAICNIMLLHY